MCWLGFHKKKIVASGKFELVLTRRGIDSVKDVMLIVERCEKCGKEWATAVPTLGKPIKVNVVVAWDTLGYDPMNTPK